MSIELKFETVSSKLKRSLIYSVTGRILIVNDGGVHALETINSTTAFIQILSVRLLSLARTLLLHKASSLRVRKRMLVSLFEALFVCCIVYAMITDALYLRIPNGVSLTLLAAFALYACYLMATQPSLLFSARLFILAHLFVGLAVFAGGVLIYTVKWIGGGDAKLLGAVGLWAGPDHATEFLITTGMLGILLAGSILVVRQIVASRPVLSTPTAIQPIVGWARAGICPYGLAIGVAALTVVPKMFYG